MLPPDTLLPLLITATFVLAGLVKGVIGLGLPTVAMGLLGVFMPPVQAAVLLLLPSLLTNLWQMLPSASLGACLRRCWPMLLGVVAGTLWAPISIVSLDSRIASAGLGAALLVYAVLGLASMRLGVAPRWQSGVSSIVGLITGVVTAATGVFVFPAVPYLQGLGLRKNELVQSLGLCFTVSTLALSVRLAADGALHWDHTASLGWFAALLPLQAALAGMALGQWLRQRLSEALFRRSFFLGLLLIALHLLHKGLSS
jgi:uncharacterized membrane protein YfcA